MPPPQTMTDLEDLMAGRANRLDEPGFGNWCGSSGGSAPPASPNPPSERIVRRHAQRRFRHHVGGAGDRRDDLVALAAIPRLEDTADDTLLHPLGAGRQLAVGGEARELG